MKRLASYQQELNILPTSSSTLPKPHLRNLLVPPILQIPHLLHQPTHLLPHLSPPLPIHLRSHLPRQQHQPRFVLRVSDLICLDDVALDAAAAPAAARRFRNGFCGDGLAGAEVAGRVVGVEGAGFCDFNCAHVAALGVDLLDGEAHWAGEIRKEFPLFGWRR